MWMIHDSGDDHGHDALLYNCVDSIDDGEDDDGDDDDDDV